jgi:K(+)-stimulated pyrophosphate-energized sodium pump
MQIQHYLWLFISVGILGLLVVAYLYARVRAIIVDNAKAAKVADAIAEGAMTFLREEYQVIAIVVAVVTGLLYFASNNILVPVYFVLGSVMSLTTGVIGMRAATKANVRTALAARDSGEYAAFMVAFCGGGVMGFAVASFGLLGVGLLVCQYHTHVYFVQILTSFGMGASLVAFFARVGGGIYTKAADVGADLAGKLEAGIPEDDPRNPAVVADNVGDCVGDTAGMGADIYESYVTAMVSAIVLSLHEFGSDVVYIMLPIVLSAIGLLGSLVGILFNLVLRAQPAAMLRNATYVSMVVFAAGAYGYISYFGLHANLFYSILLGCLSGIIVGLITEYYTASTPVHKIADSSRSGAATNLIYGLSVGMESAVLPVIVLAFAVLLSFIFGGGVYGVAIAAVSMLSTVAIIMTIDAYGPIADNAGGIAEMSHFDPSVRKITDKLDALGNTTAAMGKGFAIGSALLAALALFSAYAQEAGLTTLNLLNPFVTVGLFIGGTLPFLVSALTMRSVSNAALDMVMEVRRQFKEIAGLMAGTADPDYKKCIAISTRAALKEMVLPGLISAGAPVVIFYLLGKEALGGMLAGATLTGVLMALMMANGGGAWDNAKKYIEAGAFGGKGSEAHRAAVVGDMVGDPFKDTSGPSLNILIKLMSMVALLLIAMQ